MRRAIALCLLLASPASAQQFFSVGQELPDGRINVEVVTTIPGAAGESEPLGLQKLTLFRGATDSVTMTTDESGVVQFAVAPGNYRIAASAHRQGKTYRWNLPLEVRRGMRTTTLGAANADVSGPPLAEDVVVRRGPSEPFPGYRDPSTSALYGLLLPGAGQIYAGRVAKGVAIAGVSIAAVVAGASGTTSRKCFDAIYDPFTYELLFPGRCDAADRSSLYIGGAVAGALWLYGIIAAPHDAMITNARREAAQRVSAIVTPARGGTELGVAVRF